MQNIYGIHNPLGFIHYFSSTYGIDAHICYDAFQKAHKEHMDSHQYFAFLSELSLRSFFYKNIPCELKQDDMITRICFPNDVTRNTISKLNNELQINVMWEDIVHSILANTRRNDDLGLRDVAHKRYYCLFDKLKQSSKLLAHVLCLAYVKLTRIFS